MILPLFPHKSVCDKAQQLSQFCSVNSTACFASKEISLIDLALLPYSEDLAPAVAWEGSVEA